MLSQLFHLLHWVYLSFLIQLERDPLEPLFQPDAGDLGLGFVCFLMVTTGAGFLGWMEGTSSVVIS